MKSSRRALSPLILAIAMAALVVAGCSFSTEEINSGTVKLSEQEELAGYYSEQTLFETQLAKRIESDLFAEAAAEGDVTIADKVSMAACKTTKRQRSDNRIEPPSCPIIECDKGMVKLAGTTFSCKATFDRTGERDIVVVWTQDGGNEYTYTLGPPTREPTQEESLDLNPTVPEGDVIDEGAPGGDDAETIPGEGATTDALEAAQNISAGVPCEAGQLGSIFESAAGEPLECRDIDGATLWQPLGG